jgi:hypothetical protein
MPATYTFDERSVRTLRRDHERLRYQVGDLFAVTRRLLGRARAPREDTILGVISSTVTARVGTQWGSGELTVMALDRAGVSRETGRVETVWNPWLVPLPAVADIPQWARRDFRSGLWIVQPQPSVLALTGGSGIAARVGTALGANTVTIYYSAGGTLTATAVTFTAYNVSTAPVGAAKYIKVGCESPSALPIVEVESCA